MQAAGLLDDARVRYVRLDAKAPIGRERNMLNKLARGEVLAYQDDDDYYPPERIAHGVRLLAAGRADIVGCSVMHVYFSGTDGAIGRFGPFGPMHATAGTWMFRRRLLDTCAFDDNAAKAEERDFLHGWTVPLVQTDSMKTILVVSHAANTVDKERMRTITNTVLASTGMKLKHFMPSKAAAWAREFLQAPK
jgi:glycosyltransferase involved in cell wall biosynthesis